MVPLRRFRRRVPVCVVISYPRNFAALVRSWVIRVFSPDSSRWSSSRMNWVSRCLISSASALGPANPRSGRVGGGDVLAPPPAAKTVLKPLGLHGSHCPTIRTDTEPPVSKQTRCSTSDPGQPAHGFTLSAFQPFVLAARPPHQGTVEAFEERIQHRLVEAAVIVGPALHNAVEHAR